MNNVLAYFFQLTSSNSVTIDCFVPTLDKFLTCVRTTNDFNRPKSTMRLVSGEQISNV